MSAVRSVEKSCGKSKESVVDGFVFDKVFVGSDMGGFEGKLEVIRVLLSLGVECIDLGVKDVQKPSDYPKYAKKVVGEVVGTVNSCGILICGSGTGMQIAANKFGGVRAAFSFDVYSARMARLDNDANVLTLRGREFDLKKYEEIIETFLRTAFSNEERHIRRLKQIEEG